MDRVRRVGNTYRSHLGSYGRAFSIPALSATALVCYWAECIWKWQCRNCHYCGIVEVHHRLRVLENGVLEGGYL